MFINAFCLYLIMFFKKKGAIESLMKILLWILFFVIMILAIYFLINRLTNI
jgi:hypothetical protein